MRNHSFTAVLLLSLASQPALAGDGSARAPACVLTFFVEAAEPLEVIQFLVDYSSIAGSFTGAGTGVRCVSLVESATIVANDLCTESDMECATGRARALTLLLQHPDGLPTAAAVAQCGFDGATEAELKTLDVEVVDASAHRGMRAPSSAPQGSVSKVECPGGMPASAAFGPKLSAPSF